MAPDSADYPQAAVWLLPGHTVEILEQRAELGGLAASMRIGDYAIDTGPSAITSPEAIENIFLGGWQAPA